MINKERLVVGEILSSSWGYEQTNWDFYQIVKVSDKSIWIQEIELESKSCNYMSYEVRPIKDKFKKESKVIRKTIKDYIKLNDFQYLDHYNNGNVLIETKYY